MTQRYDLVHYHALGPALFSFIPRLFGMKTAVTVQGLDWQRKKWGDWLRQCCGLEREHQRSFQTELWSFRGRCRSTTCEIARFETIYIPNGGFLRERREPKQDPRVGAGSGEIRAYFLGRFSPEKGCHLLVQAFERIETDVKLVMAGAAELLR